MNSTTDKISSADNKAAGSIKEAVGKTTGNKNLEAEGAGQKIRGGVQEAVGTALDTKCFAALTAALKEMQREAA